MDPTAKFVIGVDIGGTKVAGGLVDFRGEIHVRSRTPMVTEGDARKVSPRYLLRFKRCSRILLNGHELKR